MADLPKDPSNQELLDRIVKVEGKLISRIMKLEKENSNLRAQCADLLEGFKSHVDGNLHEFDRMGDLLWAVAHKVFPNLSGMLGKMNTVVPPRYADPSIDRRPRDYKRD